MLSRRGFLQYASAGTLIGVHAPASRAAGDLNPPPVPTVATSPVIATSDQRAALHIVRIARPPRPDEVAGYVNLPATEFVTRPGAFTASHNSERDYPLYEILWQDRSIEGFGKKPNDASGMIQTSRGIPCRPEFTRYGTAIGSTLAKAMYSAGFKARRDPDGHGLAALLVEHRVMSVAPSDGFGFLDLADAFGYDTTRWATIDDAMIYGDSDVDTIGTAGKSSLVHFAFAAAHADALFDHTVMAGTFATSDNMAILQKGRLADVPRGVRGGFFIDCEADDDRSGADFALTIKGISLASTAKGMTLPMVSMDPLFGAGRHVGATPAGLRALLPSVRWFNIQTSTRPPGGDEVAFLQRQYDLYRSPQGDDVDGAKMCMQLNVGKPGLNQMSEEFARQAAGFARSHGFGHVLFTNSFGRPGTPEFDGIVAAYIQAATQ